MNRVVFNQVPVETHHYTGWVRPVRKGVFVLFLIQLTLVWARLLVPFLRLGDARWPDGLLVVLATATMLASLARQLPGQNVMLASVVIAVIAGAVQTLGAVAAVPFGPYVYNPDSIGQELFHPLPWAVPMVWIVAIVSSRGTARLALRPWRKTRTYGFWLIGLTALLVVLFDFALEPFATNVKNYWHWQPTKIPSTWYTTPWVNFLGWAVTALLILAFVTPALLNKRPVKHPPDYHPLVVWLLLNLLFLTGTAAHQLWLAAALILAQTVLVALFAIRGARW